MQLFCINLRPIRRIFRAEESVPTGCVKDQQSRTDDIAGRGDCAILKKKGGAAVKKLRYDPKSIRSGLTLVTLLYWILPIIIIVTMFSVLVNYYNDRKLEQAMELGMENAMHQVELRLLSVIEDSKAVSYDGIVRQSYSEASGLVYKDVTEYLTQKFTRNANYRCVFISSASGDEPVHAYAAAPGTAKLNLLRYYRGSVYPEVRSLLESVDTGIYFLTVDEEIYMVRNLLDHDFTPYAMLVLGLEKSEVFQSLYGIANVSITGVRIDGVELPVAAAEAHDAGGELCLRAYAKKDGRLFFEVEHDGEMTPDGWARIQDALQSPAAPAFVSQLTSDAVIEQFVTTEMTALAAMTERPGGAEGAEQNPDDGLPDKQATSFIVKKAIAYIEQNYAKKLSLQEVADFCYVSQWHLSKLINKYAEKSYYDLLNSVRIEKAKELLADPSLKIGDIVDLVGYSDSGHFSRTFKKRTGLSANEYRSRLK